MKVILAMAALAATIGTASAQNYGYGNYGSSGGSGIGSNPNSHYVQPHTTRDGNFVSGHYATNPNNTQRDNFGTRGNINPYNGAVGTRSPRW